MRHDMTVNGDDHVQGNSEARITLVEYGDFECPHCGRAYWDIKDVQQQFGRELRFVYRHFPLTQIHPLAQPAAEAAEFAGARDRFWEMHDAIYENQDRLSMQMLLEIAEGLALDRVELEEALERHRFHTRVQRDFLSGIKAGVNGTPTLFLNGMRFDRMASDLAEAIAGELRGQRAA